MLDSKWTQLQLHIVDNFKICKALILCGIAGSSSVPFDDSLTESMLPAIRCSKLQIISRCHPLPCLGSVTLPVRAWRVSFHRLTTRRSRSRSRRMLQPWITCVHTHASDWPETNKYPLLAPS